MLPPEPSRPVDPNETQSNSYFDYEKHPPIGIDLGTSNSAIARWVIKRNNKEVRVYTLNTKQTFGRNPNLMASWVYYKEQEEQLYVGSFAYNNRLNYPKHVVSAIKRSIAKGESGIKLGNKDFSTLELMEALAEGLFEDPISTGLENPAGIVATVPFYFKSHENHKIRQSIEGAIRKKFGHLGYLPPLLDLIPEPVAAAINYLKDMNDLVSDRILLTLDMGGGTLDLTIFRILVNHKQIEFEVMAIEGDPLFGGEEFDVLLEQYIFNKVGISTNSFSEDEIQRARVKMRDEIISLKEQLSFQPHGEISAQGIKDVNIELNITRSEFENLLSGASGGRNYGRELEGLLKKCLEKSQLEREEIHTVLLIGGSSQIPYFQEILRRMFPKAIQYSNQEDIFLGVVKGAALYAAFLLDKQYGQKHNPLNREIGSIRFLSRTSHSLGIEDFRKRMDVLIPANKIVPASYSKTYKLVQGAKDTSEIAYPQNLQVYQGESPIAGNNTLIGSIPLPAIYLHGRRLQDVPIEITFKASDTQVSVDIFIKKGSEDGSDYNATTFIHK